MQFEIYDNGADWSKPLIYMWEIKSRTGCVMGLYVGKAKAGAKRPTTHYSRNVANILAGKPYRRGKPDGYRRVHHVLARAHRQGHSITLHFLCNVESPESINEVEKRCIRERRTQGIESWQLNGRRTMVSL